MEISINANAVDQATQKIGEVLQAAFEPISEDLSNNYSGTIRHLWIDFELVQSHVDRRPPFRFRFQKKVGGGIFKLTGLPAPVCKNVGHYSVRPDFQKLLAMPLEAVAEYALGLIYASTSMLIDKQKKLGGFDAQKFRQDFLSSCKKHGYSLTEGSEHR
jgi:hypothetical protein